MNKLNTMSPRNTMAISAMLMLSAGTAFAQDATVPVTDAPVVAAPVAPTIVIPVPEPVSPAPAPVVTSAPVAEPVATDIAKPAARSPTTARTAARTAAPASPAAAREDSETVTPPVTAPVAAPAPDTREAAPPPPVASNEPGAPDWALPVGAAATLLVLGGVGLAMSRRRRPYEEDVDFVPPVATRPALRPQPESRVTPPVPPARLSAVPMASTPVVGTSGERAALIESIVASPPDAANPFRSRKARRRRARIMVQSMAARSDVPTGTPRPTEPAIAGDYASA
ncbi:hypothetical protein [Novosphingobium jiangmenense]|uniref:Uncharacterized protein n=1 Tax=Novosphingobium jiangmenense TaxID=2791981 RepID=A0ABS0HFW4_9SPHN|nr:hypothetical protein [Novosphingobium jiangmenense]MBF9151048.1 hypothetical protein [Novosphingobium jiangmenense]